MWPFMKTALRTDQLPVDDLWTIAEGENNGRVMIIRLNTGYRHFGSVSTYGYQVGIAVAIRDAGTDGLPSPAENVLLGELEDVICNSLEEKAESLLVAIITTGGMREFVFYTREPKSVELRFAQISERSTSHKMQLMIQEDKGWQVYKRLGQG
jgi:hypothetical protein